MLAKQVQFKTIGMNKDLSESAFNSLFAFDNMNIRIGANEGNTLMSLTNERGPKSLELSIAGLPVGYAVINDKIVIFTTNNTGSDKISLVEKDEDENFKVSTMFSGNLNLSYSHPLETLVSFENLNALKVYWTDGVNLPRVINVATYLADNSAFNSEGSTLFDFIQVLNTEATCDIERLDGAGMFSPGTILYVATYYNLYGLESNIFWLSSLHYISYASRGASPEDTVPCNLLLTFDKLDPTKEFLRLYSIHRTSLDAVPTVKRVIDLPIVAEQHYTWTSMNTVPVTGITDDNFAEISTSLNSTNIPIAAYGYVTSDVSGYRKYKLQISSVSISSAGSLQWVEYKGVKYYASPEMNSEPWYLYVLLDEDGNFTGSGYIRHSSNASCWYQAASEVYGSCLFIDNGTIGDVEDPTLLLYIGGKEISAGTMTLKDGTLFLGNVETKGDLLSSEFKESIRNALKDNFLFTSDKLISLTSTSGIYPYSILLNKSSSNITTFKARETYRIGVQLCKPTGEWSEPIWIKDAEVNVTPNDGLTISLLNSVVDLLVLGKLIVPVSTAKLIINAGYNRIRPVIVYPSVTDRTIICLGVLNPTVFNVLDRNSNSPFALSSWFFRPNLPMVWGSTVNTSAISGTPLTNRQYLIIVVLRLFDAMSVGDTFSLAFSNNSSLEGSSDSYFYKLILAGYSKCTSTSPSSNYEGYMYVLYPEDPSVSASTIIYNMTAVLSKYTTWYAALNKGTAYNSSSAAKVYTGGYTSGLSSLYGTPLLYYNIPAGGDATFYIGTSYNFSNNSWVYHNYMPSLSDLIFRATINANYEVISNIGSPLEFRHYHSLPVNTSRSAEILCTMKHLDSPFLDGESRYTKDLAGSVNFLEDYDDLFFIDLSILTLHSPDIEFDYLIRDLDSTLLLLKIVGYVPITGNTSDIDILTSTPALNYRASNDAGGTNKTVPLGFYKEGVGVKNISPLGYLGMVSVGAWLDELYSTEDKDSTDRNDNHYTTAFPIYPWQAEGSLNNLSSDSLDPNANSSDTTAKTVYRSSKLKKKKMSNLRFSYKPIYLSEDNFVSYNLSAALIFSSDLPINIRLNSLINEETTPNYYGNIDKIVKYLKPNYINESDTTTLTGTLYSHKYTILGFRTAASTPQLASLPHNLFNASWSYLHTNWYWGEGNKAIQRWGDCFKLDVVSMKYKSSPHGVISLAGTDSTISILPSAYNSTGEIINKTTWNSLYSFWNYLKPISITLPTIPINMSYGYLWLGELVNPNVTELTRFGGTSDDAILANTWLPCGNPVKLSSSSDSTLYYTEGDTYFLRYDCLKTYPYTMEDTNSIVDILSFVCETRVNIDGRYDRNRGQASNLVMSPVNFNLLNTSYSLRNNYFNYRILDEDMFNFEKYPHTITWTKTKTAASKTDLWTNITMASTLDLDGDRGVITSLQKWNDSIIAFLEKGVSNILYNEKMLLTTTEGVPVEIANSGKVTGSRYISGEIGCVNKYSICTTPNGIYFIDDLNKNICLFQGLTIESLTNTKGFSSWIKGKSTLQEWDPYNFNNITTLYDGVNLDVLFIGEDFCLAYSEPLNTFSSFYNYEGCPYFINYKGEGIWLKPYLVNILWSIGDTDYLPTAVITPITKVKADSFTELVTSMIDTPIVKPTLVSNNTLLYKHNAGDYNYFFGNYKPFSTTILANPEFLYDKVFSTIDFRSDTWDSDGNYLPNNTIDCIEVWNEYQKGITSKTKNNLDLKKKFRVWRALVPRNNSKSSYDNEAEDFKLKRVPRDRIRNPWAYIKLSRTTANKEKTVLHDITVNYFV